MVCLRMLEWWVIKVPVTEPVMRYYCLINFCDWINWPPALLIRMV